LLKICHFLNDMEAQSTNILLIWVKSLRFLMMHGVHAEAW